MVATFLSGRFVSRLGTERILRMGLWVQLIAGLWLAACAFFQWGLWPAAIGVAFYVGMVSVVSSNANTAVLALFPRTAGTANSLIGMLRFATGAVIGAILALFSTATDKPMLFAITLCILASVATYKLLVKSEK